jgi:enoyl-CoA hydratase/carnithine racemase
VIRASDDDAGVRTITLDRAEKRNALTTKMLADLCEAMFVPSHMRAVVLIGTGSVFCAGFDLYEGAGDPLLESLHDQLKGLSRVIQCMTQSRVPIVAGVVGAAVAGGAALLGGCDVVVAHREAKIGYPVVRLGISPAVSAPFLRRSVGDGASRAMLLDPSLLTAGEAYVKGLVGMVVDDASHVAGEAQRCATALASKPGVGLQETRALLSRIAPFELADEGCAASLAALDAETVRRLEREVWLR